MRAPQTAVYWPHATSSDDPIVAPEHFIDIEASIFKATLDTEANRKAISGGDYSKWPKPHEIARVILFLCSDDAKLIHGAAVPVYGTS